MVPALRKRNLDTVFSKTVPPPIEDFRPDIADAGFRAHCPDKDLVIDGIVAEPVQPDDWVWIGKHARRGRCGLSHRPLRQIDGSARP